MTEPFQVPDGFLRMDTQHFDVYTGSGSQHFAVETWIAPNGESFFAGIDDGVGIVVKDIVAYRDFVRELLDEIHGTPFVAPEPTRHIAIDTVSHGDGQLFLRFWPVLLQVINEYGSVANALGPYRVIGGNGGPEHICWEPNDWRVGMPKRISDHGQDAVTIPWSRTSWNCLRAAQTQIIVAAYAVSELIRVES